MKMIHYIHLCKYEISETANIFSKEVAAINQIERKIQSFVEQM